MGAIVLISVLAVVALAVIFGVGRLLDSGAVEDMLAAGRRFEFQGETFVWVPDGEEGLLDHPFEFGDFQYADGTPVTDLMTLKLLREHWRARLDQMRSSDYS